MTEASHASSDGAEAARPSKRERAGRLLGAAPVRAVARRVPLWRGLLVLNYHRIGNDAGGLDPRLLSATPEQLDAQLTLLRRDVDLIGPAEVPEALTRRGRHVLLTFDDGYRDNYELAFPILRSHGVRAAFFLATGFLDRPRLAWWDEIAWMVRRSTRRELAAGSWLDAPIAFDEPTRSEAIRRLTDVYKSVPGDRVEGFLDFLAEVTGSGRPSPSAASDLWMSWSQAREMHTAGMTMGGHTVGHPVLSNLDPSEQRKEIDGCARRIAEELGTPMRLFSYPVGWPTSFNEQTRASLRENGVELAFSCYGGFQRAGAWDPYDLPRATIGVTTTIPILNAMITAPRFFARW